MCGFSLSKTRKYGLTIDAEGDTLPELIFASYEQVYGQVSTYLMKISYITRWESYPVIYKFAQLHIFYGF